MHFKCRLMVDICGRGEGRERAVACAKDGFNRWHNKNDQKKRMLTIIYTLHLY